MKAQAFRWAVWLALISAHLAAVLDICGQTVVINSFRHAGAGGGGETLATDLVAHWKLDEASGTRADSHGSFDLTDNNTVTSGAGLLGDAAEFVAANTEFLNRLSIDSTDLVLGDFDWTFALWVRAGSLSSASGLITWGSPGVDMGLRAAATTGGISIRTASGNHSASAAISTGTWALLVVWFDAANDLIWLQMNDGTAESFAQATVASAATEFRLGRSEFSQMFDGRIDSVSVWRRLLDSSERSDLYNAGAGLNYEDF